MAWFLLLPLLAKVSGRAAERASRSRLAHAAMLVQEDTEEAEREEGLGIAKLRSRDALRRAAAVSSSTAAAVPGVMNEVAAVVVASHTQTDPSEPRERTSPMVGQVTETMLGGGA